MVQKFSLKILLFFFLMIPACGRGFIQPAKAFFRMDTVTEVTLVVKRGTDVNSIWKSIDSLFADWEVRFSVSGDSSEVRKLNECESDTCVVGKLLGEILRTALRYGDSLNGRFDITVLPLKELWGVAEDSSPDSTVPSPEQVDSVLRYVGYSKIKMRGDTVIFLSPGIRVDAGGIAKGFVLREAAELLDRRGISGYLVAAGGDILARGKKADGSAWVVGIRDPEDRDEILGTVELDSGSIVTSGDYERFRIVNGKRYHHIFNPATGYSCSRNRSLTVRGSDPVEIDILSTGLFCMDPEEIISYFDARSRLEGVVVDSSGKIFVSRGWKEELKLWDSLSVVVNISR